MTEQRPNPEKLLQRSNEEEQQDKRGKLRIYLGAAPGVGKTHAMLQDAIAKRAQGLDVVVGVAESHGRQEIETLIKQLEILPRKTIEYRDKPLSEFDLDAALKRSPALLLIDEMAHTNVPGSRHTKRWQDIKELLDRGMNIYTTLNVQHIESLNDIVSQIIGIPIKETVPDSMLEMAETIELMDLPPEDLLKRLQEGKVYFPGQIELAKENFFRKGNLTALRELALRVTAELVNVQVFLYRQGQGIKDIWPTKQKILVCISAGIESIKLIRAGRRMAANLQAEWVVLHVDAPRLRLSEQEHNNAVQYLRFAEQLGADTRTITGPDLVKEIVSFAHEQNITRIIMGKKIKPRWKELLFRSLTNEVIRQSGEIDVYIITGKITGAKSPKYVTPQQGTPWKTYGISIGIVAIATVINYFVYPYSRPSNLILVYLLGVTLVALLGRMGPSILASILSVLAYDFFFAPSMFSFVTNDLQYIFTLVLMLVVAYVISHLTIRVRRQADTARLAERRSATLHTLSRQLASARGIDKLLEIGTHNIAEVFDSEVLALLPENNHLVIHTQKSEQLLSEKEQAVAQWVYDLGQTAGLGTDTLPYSDAIYVPLLASQNTIGVLRVCPKQPKRLFDPEQMHLLEACANQIATALEVDRLHEQTRKSELQIETDRVRSTLLQSVSHDLRTPLVAIMGAASTLIEIGGELDTKKIHKLGKDIYFESEQLNRLINNLLQMTYLETESVTLQKELTSLNDVIALVVKSCNKKLGKKPIHLLLTTQLPLIPLDNTLIQEVFINLIDNAIKFTPPTASINISAFLEKDKVVVCVEDQGPGIVSDEESKLFEKFYRGRMLTTERGLGLGLAICHSIIKAHGGEIWAANRKDGGAVFCFTLPLVP